MKNNVTLVATDNKGKNVVLDMLDFEFRVNKNIFTPSKDKLKILGGTYTTSIELAKNHKNNIFFKRHNVESIGKFDISIQIPAKLMLNGATLVEGYLKTDSISNRAYEVTFFGQDVNWIDLLSNLQLNNVGYVDGQPTWLVGFDGAASFNVVNEQTNVETDYICPTIVYNNTPITDYLDLVDGDIWGTYETNPSPPPAYNRLTNGGSFPNDFITVNGLFGDRLGLTFEDFPPAVYYKNLLVKVFESIGLSVNCPLFNEVWFNHIYMAYTGNGYEYNWKNLASVSAELLPKIEDNITGGLYDTIELRYEADIDVPNQADAPPGSGTAQLHLEDVILKIAGITTIGHDDINTLVDKITAVNKFDIPNQYIAPVDGRYRIRINSAGATEYTNFYNFTDGVFSYFEGYDVFDSYGSGDINSNKTSPLSDRAYAWDDHVLLILRKNQNDEFVFNTEELLGKWVSGNNQDFINQPSDVIGYLSPKRYGLYQLGILTNEREAFGSPLSNFTENVTVNQSVTSHTVFSNTNFEKSARSVGEFEVSVDLLKNERIEIIWVAIETFKGTIITYFPDQGLDKINDVAIGTNQLITPTCDYEINYECGQYDLDLAKNLPAISCKEFVANFIEEFNLYFTFDNNTVNFYPVSQFYSDETWDITKRVVDGEWIAKPIEDLSAKLMVGYDNDKNDRLLLNSISLCTTDTQDLSSYGNVIFNSNSIYAEGSSEISNGFSATRFVDGQFQAQDLDIIAPTFPTSTDWASGVEIYKGIDWGFASLDIGVQFPSIQSQESFDQNTVGDLTYSWDYTPRLLYHLGTIHTYLAYQTKYQCFIDSPRADATFVELPKHWYRPTVSAFHDENGNIYPTLRYDTEDGIFNRFFENSVEIYEKSEVLTLKMNMRNIDFWNMQGQKKIVYKNQLYRLMKIQDYDPVGGALATIELMREL